MIKARRHTYFHGIVEYCISLAEALLRCSIVYAYAQTHYNKVVEEPLSYPTH